MNNLFFGWLFLGITFIIIELGHPGLFFFLSFALGAIGAAFAGLWCTLPEQIVVFIVTAVSSSWVAWRSIKKRKGGLPSTNMYALHGVIGTVITKIPAHGVGQVKINGEQWSARTHNQELAVGTSVIVLDVQGCHLIVKPHTV